MVWPGPTTIAQFPPLPNAEKSKLEGDTIQVSNVSAYFSDNFREFATNFYRKNYQTLSGFPFPPITLNHPPEYSWNVIKRHTDSTYLEEFVYPLRDSIYVNGLELFYQDGTPKFWGITKFELGEKKYFTKVTLRFFPSQLLPRILVWIGIIISLVFLFSLAKKILFEKYE